jgi:transcription elongation GreA/GreB family factor
VSAIDKQALLEQVLASLEQAVQTATAAQRATASGATHEESKPENDKDTRAIEATYLARGQAQRVTELEHALRTLRALVFKPWGKKQPIALGALIEVERQDTEPPTAEHFFLLPVTMAEPVTWPGGEARVVTPPSAVGRALLGKRTGDDVEVKLPQGTRSYSVVRVL